MASVALKSITGAESGRVELPDVVFGIEPNLAVMHQVVTAQLAHRRAGTHSTKTRAEVRGGGAKPWRQKGTGRARQGSIRAPHWRGGGVAHGPKPRDYSKKVNKKVVALALRSALSDRAAGGNVMVVDDWGIGAPKTKDAIKALEALGLRTKGERAPRVLVVLFRSEEAAWKSFRNLGERVQVILPEELNAYDVLVNDIIVFSRASLEAATARFTGATIAVGEAVVSNDDDTQSGTVDGRTVCVGSVDVADSDGADVTAAENAPGGASRRRAGDENAADSETTVQSTHEGEPHEGGEGDHAE